ncbi:nucleotidyl transferase AbiEii/AbiGii toxin family protein [Rhodococcus wratislaviensis]|uniref:nucleotidyl transferase AbiEii/AbiGii toxin family protein n=1 Tax=Rhodococcus wratislaviensis TaxID=44752 RepID=UPI001CED8916|nr:nucleotidyl transferase AbiEii/AbiGii toxin family protein [Rhodococcus wratislaviensis]
MSGNHVTFVGDAMAAVAAGVIEVRALIGQAPVIVGGLAVLARLSNPYRATVDLDLVDRLLGDLPQLEVLRAADGAEPVEPAAVLLPTRYGSVKVDVLEVRQVELDHPSDDPGDRLHASAHAWANDTATGMTIEVIRTGGERVVVTTPVAEPGPLIAMKLQAVMNRSADKQGTDLLDIVHLILDETTRPAALAQIGTVGAATARDIALHVDLWFTRNRLQSLQRIHAVGGRDITTDDLDLVAELLTDATQR